MLLLHLPLMRLPPCLFVLQGCFNSLYKPSYKGLSSITKMGEIESAWLPPCVVLVINDNPYGLMFTLRYSYRSCPWENIGVHVLDSWRWHDDQCSIQGFIWRMVMCRFELIASMAWKRRLSEFSCLSPSHHIYQEKMECKFNMIHLERYYLIEACNGDMKT